MIGKSLIQNHIIVFYRENIPEQLETAVKKIGSGSSIIKDGIRVRNGVSSFRLTIVINSSSVREFKQNTNRLKLTLEDLKKRFLIDDYEAKFLNNKS